MKWFLDVVIVFGVVMTYVLMSAYQPAVNDIIATVNATGSWSGMEETQNFVNAYPLYQWLIPGFVGIIAIVMNHVLSNKQD